jgi:hypothetical protein
MPLSFRESRRGNGQGVLKWKASVDAPRRSKLRPSSRSNKHKAAIKDLRMKPSRALLPAKPKRQSNDELPSPVSLLGASRVDPFATYPVRSFPFLQQMGQPFKIKMSQSKQSSTAPSRFNCCANHYHNLPLPHKPPTVLIPSRGIHPSYVSSALSRIIIHLQFVSSHSQLLTSRNTSSFGSFRSRSSSLSAMFPGLPSASHCSKSCERLGSSFDPVLMSIRNPEGQ